MEKKRVGIVTLYYKNYNYGGLLQAYALQKTLEKLGFDAEQISIDRNGGEIKKEQRNLKSFIRYTLIRNVSNYLKDVKAGFFSKKRKLSDQYFENFMNSIPHSKVFNQETIHNANKDYDVFVCGSDQIWNPIYANNMYYLNFAEMDKKRISYAASIGVETLTDEETLNLVQNIKNFDAISVREKTGKDIIQPKLDREVTVVLDPTLLLESNEWDSLVGRNPYEFEYLLVYCLGFTSEFIDIIHEFAKANSLKIVNIPTRPEHVKIGDINVYEVGPKEFITLIKYSSYVLTDSFHASVFSIIYEKQFRTFSREISGQNRTMNSRIRSLMDLLENEEILLKKTSTVDNLNENISFENYLNKISDLRKFALQFIYNNIQN